MSQNISVTGSQSPVITDSGNIRPQDDTGAFAREILADAPPSLESTLDTAREMTSVPERDLPEEVLSRRNEETGETVAGRNLTAALESGDKQAMRDAAEHLEGRSFTPQMEGMLEHAKVRMSSSEETDETGPLEESRETEDTSDVAEAPEENTPAILDLSVGKELFDILCDLKKGTLVPGNSTLEELEEKTKVVNNLITSLSESQEGGSTNTVLLTQLIKCQIQLSDCIASRTNMESLLSRLEDLKNAQETPSFKLERLVDFMLTLQNSSDQMPAFRSSTEEKTQRLQNPLQNLALGVMGRDFDRLKNAVLDAMTEQLEQLQSADKTPLGKSTLQSLAQLCINAGKPPAVMFKLLSLGLSWAATEEHKNALVQALDKGIAATVTTEGRSTVEKRGETLRYVDMAFQGSYPEHADEALALKKLLLPEYENEVTLQHECMVASRQLLSILMEGEQSRGLGTPNALSRALQGTASARSFVLTPDIVKGLTNKVDLENFNYHLAHVAVLQKRAAEAGLFPLSEEQKARMTDVHAWCLSLNLGTDAAAYAGKLDHALDDEAQKARCMHEIQQASAHFVRGFRGQTELSLAGRIIQKRTTMTESMTAGRRENAIFESSPEYMARLALDHHIVNLSGLILPEERFSGEDSAMTLDGNAVDQAMKTETEKLYQTLFGNENPDDARARMEDMSRERREYLQDLQRFESHAGVMQSLAHSTREGVKLRASIHESQARVDSMKQDKALLHFTWPHRRIGRLKTCNTVFEIESLSRKLTAATTERERETLQREINTRLKELKGISPFTLASSIRHRKETPSLETVLEHMLPRARALRFFEQKITLNGVTTTEAADTLRRIKNERASLKVHQKNISRSMDNLRSQFGKDNIRRLQQTITAGLYKVFVESQQPLSSFTINDTQTRQAVYAQLESWGMPVHAGLTAQLIRLTLAALTSADGTLREETLRSEAAKSNLDHVGKEHAETMKSILRDEGASRLSAWKKTRDFVNNTLLPDDRRRAEGVRSLLREASRPGSGFVYDRARGMVVDTGAVFSPLTSPKSLVNMVSLAHPLSARMRLTLNDSLTVSNVGNGCYQVMLKGGFAASLGATMKVAIPGTPLTLIPGGNAGFQEDRGVAITFSSEKDCEAFLNAFMTPDSSLHDKKKYDPSLWLCASQVRFIDGDTVSANLSLGLMASMFQQVLPLGIVASGSSTVSVALAGDISQQVEQNASGETTTINVKKSVTLAGNFSIGASKGEIYFGSPLTTVGGASTLALDERFKIVTGPQGVMPATCMETECLAGPLKRGVLHDITRALLLPASVSDRILEDVAFSDAFEKLLRGMPPTARVIVRRELKPAVLEEVRRLFIKVRMATDEYTRSTELKRAHSLLATPDSYTPSSISIRNVTPADISRNWSPGLGAFQYARNTSFASLNSGDTLTIPLPQGE